MARHGESHSPPHILSMERGPSIPQTHSQTTPERRALSESKLEVLQWKPTDTGNLIPVWNARSSMWLGNGPYGFYWAHLHCRLNQSLLSRGARSALNHPKPASELSAHCTHRVTPGQVEAISPSFCLSASYSGCSWTEKKKKRLWVQGLLLWHCSLCLVFNPFP